jgi:hypothetical protein
VVKTRLKLKDFRHLLAGIERVRGDRYAPMGPLLWSSWPENPFYRTVGQEVFRGARALLSGLVY